MPRTKSNPSNTERQPGTNRLKKPTKKKLKSHNFKDDDLSQLEQDIAQLSTNPSEKPELFVDLPLSKRTLCGLDDSGFTTLTDIQARAIPLALKGQDILGAAKTGSGKTLAFIIPVLEKLVREKWSKQDGLGALVISPTRELAMQIFEVLRKVGRYHMPSAGLIEGGMNFKEEAERIPFMNIIIGTPGRLLQHLDKTPGFSVDNLQILVLDEADRILDMGFQREVDALVEHLPKTRQTLLFSATQTRKVSDLARLSLRDPEYISVHAKAVEATPAKLTQYYMSVPLSKKIDMLWSFIKSNLKSKIIVFVSSSKQVRFLFECFRRLQPGISLLNLYGRKGQEARMKIARDFANAKYSCLIATDIVARGVDFPAVDWVIQFDCPEDADTYIHRVGRTARYESEGKAVLFLDPSEEKGMLRRLEEKKIPIQKMHPRHDRQKSIQDEIQQICFKENEMKYIARKAVQYYAQSIGHMKDRDVFNVNALDLDGMAISMGLPGAPEFRFRQGTDIKKIKNAPRAGLSDDDDENDSDDQNADGNMRPRKTKQQPRTKLDRLFERKNQDVLSKHQSATLADVGLGDEENDDSNFLTVKRVLSVGSGSDNEVDVVTSPPKKADGSGPKILTHLGPNAYIVDSKRREKGLRSKKTLLKYKGAPSKIYFDDDGKTHAAYELQDEEAYLNEGGVREDHDAKIRRFLDAQARSVAEHDAADKLATKERLKEKRLKRKLRELELQGGGGAATDEQGESWGPTVATRPDEDGEVEDPLALLRSLPVAGGHDSDGSDAASDHEDRPRKKARRDKEKKKKEKRKDKETRKGAGVVELQQDPETLEDLEAVAMNLLE